MNKCFKCNIVIHTNSDSCPICHNKIKLEEKDSIYPVVKPAYKLHQRLLKITKFLSLCGILFSVFINLAINKEISWAIFVILGIVSFFTTFTIGIKRQKSFFKLLFMEIISIIILAIVWDYYTGFYKWSISFVFPLLCIAYTITFLILRIFTNKVDKDYIIYTYLNSLIGLVPLYFIIFKKLSILVPSYISVGVSIFTLLFLFMFNHHTIESEMERRLHF